MTVAALYVLENGRKRKSKTLRVLPLCDSTVLATAKNNGVIRA